MQKLRLIPSPGQGAQAPHHKVLLGKRSGSFSPRSVPVPSLPSKEGKQVLESTDLLSGPPGRAALKPGRTDNVLVNPPGLLPCFHVPLEELLAVLLQDFILAQLLLLPGGGGLLVARRCFTRCCDGFGS